MTKISPYKLFEIADGNSEEFIRLMHKHGHIKIKNCTIGRCPILEQGKCDKKNKSCVYMDNRKAGKT
jgi:hypothetical protein